VYVFHNLNMIMTDALELIENRLLELEASAYSCEEYQIPTYWLKNDPCNCFKDDNYISKVNPIEYFLHQIRKIQDSESSETIKLSSLEYTRGAVVYNMMIRYATAFKHSGGSELRIDCADNEFRETGTFLKAIAILPYIQSLGVNTIYLLPITAIGKDRKKGNAGSPYAVKNHFQPDEMLSEPILDLSPGLQFRAFVDAAHCLGMKVIHEFVFRTMSVDSDLAIDHPEWFYWINEADKNKYGMPRFLNSYLDIIRTKVDNEDYNKLPLPDKDYRSLFKDPPELAKNIDGKVYGLNDRWEKMIIPSAFCDWPPDDPQPLWDDVTYLKLHDHPDYNYISYNTVRMYDKCLDGKNYRVEDLWEYLRGIIPYYIQHFNIDGVMLDMGHSLPRTLRSAIVDTVKQTHPEFVFWEENFYPSIKSVNEGYDAVVGKLCLDEHNPKDLKKYFDLLSREGSVIAGLATAETHNTPRAASDIMGVNFNKMTWFMNNLLPAVPFIHAGFELCETIPVNTGLGFNTEEAVQYPASKLALFSYRELHWSNKNKIIYFIRQVSRIRVEYQDLICDYSADSFVSLKTSSEEIISFMRVDPISDIKIFFVCSYADKKQYFTVGIPGLNADMKDLINDQVYNVVNGNFICELEPRGFICAIINNSDNHIIGNGNDDSGGDK
jgi:starch synthase (maltosyl-transferring)